jgi:hypothetical protein
VEKAALPVLQRWIPPLVRWIKKLEKLNADPVDRNHVGLKQGIAVVTKHIVDI